MARLLVALLLVGGSALVAANPQERPTGQGFSFRTGVELVNVTATVTDQSGRFVPGLTAQDFVLYEDGKPQEITLFESERVPVSLGIALDTSGSMLGEKIVAAQAALNRFLIDLLGAQDEVFLYRFDSRPMLVQGWTEDRRSLSRVLGAVKPNGGTAMYDTVAEAIPLVQRGQFRKKALLVISDGNDTSSRTRLRDVQQLIRESEALVYAVGIDCSGSVPTRRRSGIFQLQRGILGQRRPPIPIPFPFPVPGGRGGWPRPSPQPPDTGGWTSPCNDPVNVAALRDLTDDSGGRTEIIREPRDLDPATANIADELSKQYYLGYPSAGKKDGRWHAIRVEVRNHNFRVRARRGYVAS